MRLCFRAALAALLLAAAPAALVHADEPEAAVSAETAAQDARSAEADTKFDWAAEAPEVAADGSGSSSVWSFVKVVLALVVVAGCVYAVFVFMRKGASGGAQPHDPFLRQVAHLSLGPGKSVRVVSLMDKAYIVGVGEGGVSLIAEVADKELVDSMNIYADKHDRTSRPKSFADVLEMFMPSRGGNVFASGAESAAASLQKQRERFGGRGGEE